ncbi:MAG: lipid-A-disaccharide synthase [Thermodesulfobacteriota bacterium]
MADGLRVVVVAGEASGDLHAAKLIRELGQIAPGLIASGIGGPALEKAGVDLLFRSEDLALVGFSEVLGKLGQIWRALRGLTAHLKTIRPDLIILVDFPDFNFRVAKAAKRLGLKVLYYVSPQVWAWRQKRAQVLARLVDHLAVVFPFEKAFYAGVAPDLPVTFVGHPLLDEEEEWLLRAKEPLPVPAGAELIGLLPGSRKSEIDRLLPLLLKAAAILRHKRPHLHFVLPVAPGLAQEILDPHLEAHPLPGLTVLPGRAAQVMAQSRLLLVASGTATLQAALAEAPMVVVYKTGALNYALASRLVKVPHIAMPNLIVGRDLLPELIQGQATPDALASRGLELVENDAARQRMILGLKEIRGRLGGAGASRRAAELALAVMRGNAS